MDQTTNEVAPPGWSGTVKAMLDRHPEIDNPYALAWYMKNKGHRPHYKPMPGGKTTGKGKPKRKDEALSFKEWMQGGENDWDFTGESVATNPGRSGLDQMRAEYRTTELRGVLALDGNVYVWPAEAGQHFHMENVLRVKAAQRFELDGKGGGWRLHVSRWSSRNPAEAEKSLMANPRVASLVA